MPGEMNPSLRQGVTGAPTGKMCGHGSTPPFDYCDGIEGGLEPPLDGQITYQ